MDDFIEIIGVVGFIVLLLVVPIWLIGGLRISTSEQAVSGVVYNTSNNAWLSGNTNFSVRASEDTYVSEENRSSYCLPPNSPYIDIVNKAALDKNTKVIVTTEKHFSWQFAPWTCVPIVKVELAEE